VTSTTWRVTGLHHVAVAQGDDRACDAAAGSLIGPPAHTEQGPGFVERMYDVGAVYLQTLEANGEGVIGRFLERRGPGLHHMAFVVDSIDRALDDLADRGVALIDRRARRGGMGTRIAFLHPSAFGGVLVELVEEPVTASSSEDEAGRDGA
jgi:methylmalonyl-CoA/ethylmalonyl-CoA epimerase